MKLLRILLAAALAAALLCACGQAAPSPAPTPPPEPDEPVLSNDITALYCSDGNRLLRFHRDDEGNWLWTDDPSFPLDGRYVDILAAIVRELEALEPIPSPQGPETYDLYNVQQYITVRRQQKTSVTFHFGKQAESGEYYVNSTTDPDRICLAPERMMTAIGRSIYDMALLPQLPALSADRLQTVSVTCGEDTQTFTVRRGHWLLDDEDVTDEPRIRQLQELLAAPVLTRCLDYAPSAGAAELCGLAPPAAAVQAEYVDPDSGDASFTLCLGAPMGDDACCVTVNDDTTIYLMDSAALAVLRSWNE